MRYSVALVFLVGLGMALNGCITNQPPRPTVYAYPPAGISSEQHYRDTVECQNWAQQQTGYTREGSTAAGVGTGAAIGAVGGAAAGAAIGAATGGGAGAARGAAIGAAAGGVGGAVAGGTATYHKSQDGYNHAYAACMRARGYEVQ